MMNTIKRARQEEGFTLIELLIVIVILGILAAVVVFAVGGITDRGDEAACKADVKTAEVAIEAFRAQSATNVYPTELDDVVPAFMRADDGLAGDVLTRSKYTVTYGGAATPTLTVDVTSVAGATNKCTDL